MSFLGINLDVHGWGSWGGTLAVVAIGMTALEFIRRKFLLQWGTIQKEIEKEIKRREALS